jgi:hypothetical protein
MIGPRLGIRTRFVVRSDRSRAGRRDSGWFVTCAVGGLLVMTAFPRAQGHIANAVTETRSAAQGLERQVALVALRRTPAWIGYSLPSSAGAASFCSRVALEPPTQFVVLARIDRGQVIRLTTLTPNCDVDAGGVPVVWLTDVSAAESVAWLAKFVRLTPDRREVEQDLSRPALTAIGLHATDAAPRLIQIVRTTTDRSLRKQAMTWLGRSRDPQAVRFFEELLNAK